MQPEKKISSKRKCGFMRFVGFLCAVTLAFSATLPNLSVSPAKAEDKPTESITESVPEKEDAKTETEGKTADGISSETSEISEAVSPSPEDAAGAHPEMPANEQQEDPDMSAPENAPENAPQEPMHDENLLMTEHTIVSEPAADGAVAVISGLLPVGAEAHIEMVVLSEDAVIGYFGAEKADRMQSLVAYDIKIMVDGEEWQPEGTVSVDIRQGALQANESKALAVAHVDSETEELSLLNAVIGENGDVSFTTESFSLYLFYTFTVDFNYGGLTYSCTGLSRLLLSELFRELEIDRGVEEVVSVVFSDETLLTVAPQADGDWLLVSRASFNTREILTIVFSDGESLEIIVTDDNYSNGQLTLAGSTVLISIDGSDNASFSQLQVKVTANNAPTPANNKNRNNKGRIDLLGANDVWTKIDEITAYKNIDGGQFVFNLANLTAQDILNNQYRVSLTEADKKAYAAADEPQSELFYLTDLMPKSGFRSWVLDPDNGYLDANGAFDGDIDALANAYKMFDRLGLTLAAGSETKQAGQTVDFPITLSSDEAMRAGGVIDLLLADLMAAAPIPFGGDCTVSCDAGTATIADGKISAVLSAAVPAGTSVHFVLSVPLPYDTALGTHAVRVDARYSESGVIKTQKLGEGSITVEKPDGWHITSAEGPEIAAPSEGIVYTVTVRNFDTTPATINNASVTLAGSAVHPVSLKAGQTVYPEDAVSIVIPAGAYTDGVFEPGETVIKMSFAAPAAPVAGAALTIAAADAQAAQDSWEGTLSVVAPTVVIQPQVDYDPTAQKAVVKLLYPNPETTGSHTLQWTSVDSTDPFAPVRTVGTEENVTLTKNVAHAYPLPDAVVNELVALGENSEQVLFRLTDTMTGAPALSNQVSFENLAELMDAVEVIYELAGHYHYNYAQFRELIDNLYYVEVARDSKAPFHDPNSLMLYLLQRKNSGGLPAVVSAWEKYRYDLYDPTKWPTDSRSTGEGAVSPYRDTVTDKYDFGDLDYDWGKDKSNSPFHNNPASQINRVEGAFEDYFKNLQKTAGAVENGDANEDRVYTIDLTAEATANALVPAAIVFQIQTSWQMFDLGHANGVNGTKGSPCNVTSMATLYDIKHAMIDFADWLRTNNDNSIVFAITDVEHAGSFNAIGGSYFTNDPDTLIKALEGWDIFGNCEHVHYTQNAYNAAVTNLGNSSYFTNWVYVPDDSINLYNYARKVAVVIGGSTENSNGDGGYGASFVPGDSMNYLYTVRANSGTGILSWLDYQGTMDQRVADKSGIAYKNVDTRQKVFNTLVDIVNQFQALEASRSIQNITVSDVITDEFAYVAGSARIVRIVDGEEEETPVTPVLTNETDADGNSVVKVSYTFTDPVMPGETIHLRFDVQAKENYIGSNNVYTNVGKANLSYTDKIMKEKNVDLDFAEDPQVNVPIRYNIEDGKEITVGLNDHIDLWTLGETITKQMDQDEDGIDDWAVRYDQINGTVTYQWLRQNGVDAAGNPIYEAVSAVSTPVHVTNGEPDVSFVDLPHDFSSPVEGDFPFVLKTTFTPDAKADTWTGVNDGPVSPLTKYGTVLVHVRAVTQIHLIKVDADTGAPLKQAEFVLEDDTGTALTATKVQDGVYALTPDGTTTLVCSANGTLTIKSIQTGSYVLRETKPPRGYGPSTGSLSFTTLGESIQSAQNAGDDWSFDADSATVTVTNKRGIVPPVPTPGNDTRVTVTKLWSGDADDQSHRSAVRMELYMDGLVLAEAGELSDTNNWTYTWNDLPYADDSGTAYTYTIQEATKNPWYEAGTPVKVEIPGRDPMTRYLRVTSVSDLDPNSRYVLYSSTKNSLLGSGVKLNGLTLSTDQVDGINYIKIINGTAEIPDSTLWCFGDSGSNKTLTQISTGNTISADNKGNFGLNANPAADLIVSADANGLFTIRNAALVKYLQAANDSGGINTANSATNDAKFTVYKQVVLPKVNPSYSFSVTNTKLDEPVHSPAEVTLPVVKLVDACDYAARTGTAEFTFTLTQADSNPANGCTMDPANGLTLTIPAGDTTKSGGFELALSKEGTFVFELSETEGTEEGWQYDKVTYEITIVTVYDEATDKLVPTTSFTVNPSGDAEAWREAYLHPADGETEYPFKNGYWPKQPPEKERVLPADAPADGAVCAGDEIEYEISYFNHHAEAAVVTIEDILADYFDFDQTLQSTDFSGSWDANSRTVRWEIQNVPAHTGGTVKLRLIVNANAMKQDSVSNTASVKIGNDGTIDTKPVVTEVLKCQLKIRKVDSTNTSLKLTGAKFKLYTDEACANLYTAYADAACTTEATEFTTGTDGSVTAYGLTPGTYYLNETIAPSGYFLIDEALKVTISRENVVTVDSAQKNRITVDDEPKSVIVMDSPYYEIPTTGSFGVWPFIIIGVLLMGIGVILLNRRRKK